jgi:serine/threonine protein kinase/Tol biopolymer transport system component
VSRTLKPEDRISHYRVVGPLGAGGMGEVYRAQDRTLERDVALKILPPEVVRSEERLRRFVLEAKSASSLNHPHIVTIYEIGQDLVHSGDGEPGPDSSPLHFISMELVNGKTLAAKIHQEKADLKTLLGWLAQAAEGLAKAHAAGIVHRDLKPGNIMVNQDGYAKVLDFGLAKLIERTASPDVSTAPTMTEEGTSEGVVLGTVGYMAPEQVRGQEVDGRADVFAFGAILYEAATRRRPFAAESNVETMHRILHDVPAPIEQLNDEAPAELRRLIRRCLAKDANLRVQSMKDVALELREIVDEYDALSASASSGSGSAVAGSKARNRLGAPGWIAIGLLSLALSATGWLVWRRSGDDHELVLRQITSNTPGMAVTECAISPDGQRVAYADPSGVYVKSIDSGETERLGISMEHGVWALAWFPDGTRLLLSQADRYGKVSAPLSVYSFAGAKLRRLWDRVGDFAISPDGSQIALMRAAPGDSTSELWICGPNGENARRVPSVGGRISTPTWSPDARRVAYLRILAGEPDHAVQTSDVMKGDTVTVARYGAWQVGGGRSPVLWTADDRIVFGRPEAKAGDVNLWDVRVNRHSGRPVGRPRRLTRTQGSIAGSLSASADGARLCLSRLYPNSDVYLADIEDRGRRLARIRPLTRDVRYDWPMEWSRDNQRMLFVSNRNGHRELFLQDVDAETPERLVSAGTDVLSARFTSEGRSVLFWLDQTSTPSDSGTIMRVPATGGPYEALPRGGTHGTARCKCACAPETRCVLGEIRNGELVVSTLDPEIGKGAELARFELPGALSEEAWDLSPDGTRLVAAGPDSVLRIVDLRTRSERLVTVPGWSAFQFVTWDARGEGWFVTSWWDKGRALLRVDPDGRAFLLHNTQQWLGRPTGSPDGRRLAFSEQVFDGNVWIAERR